MVECIRFRVYGCGSLVSRTPVKDPETNGIYEFDLAISLSKPNYI